MMQTEVGRNEWSENGIEEVKRKGRRGERELLKGEGEKDEAWK